jgi:hypothetical protein
MNEAAVGKYLRHYGCIAPWTLQTSPENRRDIRRVVVIPALAESAQLFHTLASLAANPDRELDQTLVICVVNNHAPPLADHRDIRDNQDTIEALDRLTFQRRLPGRKHDDPVCAQIADSHLRLAYIDASSTGREIPAASGGVGTARKIGMDHALALINPGGEERAFLCCLDADTLVQENYLAALARHFAATHHPAAVSAYAHQKPAGLRERAAICDYELFLRSYVIGLEYAGSPYAYHAIGSTMACTAEAYLAVRGMNRRRAAEDFHFLDKLAKIGRIGTVTDTTVFPSARPSWRVPFGTGQSVRCTLDSDTEEGGRWIYDPRIFRILRRWLAAVQRDPEGDVSGMIGAAQAVHPALGDYLLASRFDRDWERIHRNSKHPRQLLRQFHGWFDALRTLRAIHRLQEAAFPAVPLPEGLAGLMAMIRPDFPGTVLLRGQPGIGERECILALLRDHFPDS